MRAYVSTVWGCPYEGDIPVAKSVHIAKRLIDLGCYQISLGDTIGVGTPKKTHAVVEAMLSEIPNESVALHFHDTRGTALANVLMTLADNKVTLISIRSSGQTEQAFLDLVEREESRGFARAYQPEAA